MRARSPEGEPTSRRRRAGSPSSEQAHSSGKRACRRASALGALARELGPPAGALGALPAGSAPGEHARRPCPRARRHAHTLAVLLADSPSCPRARQPGEQPRAFRAHPPHGRSLLVLLQAGTRSSEHAGALAEPARVRARALILVRARPPTRTQRRTAKSVLDVERPCSDLAPPPLESKSAPDRSRLPPSPRTTPAARAGSARGRAGRWPRRPAVPLPDRYDRGYAPIGIRSGRRPTPPLGRAREGGERRIVTNTPVVPFNARPSWRARRAARRGASRCPARRRARGRSRQGPARGRRPR